MDAVRAGRLCQPVGAGKHFYMMPTVAQILDHVATGLLVPSNSVWRVQIG